MRKRFSYKRQAASCSGQMTHQIQRLLIPLAQQHSTIMGPYASRVQSYLDPPAALRHAAPSASRRKVSPAHCRHGARGRATRVGPARLWQGLEPRPIEFPIAQQHLRWDQPADEFDEFRWWPQESASLARVPPGQWVPFIDHMDHQPRTIAAHAAAIHDEHQRLQGEIRSNTTA